MNSGGNIQNHTEDGVIDGWSPSMMTLQLSFEEAYCDREDSINIEIDDDHHVVDFTNMTLTNVESGDERDIRRQDEYVAPDGYVNAEVLQPHLMSGFVYRKSFCQVSVYG